MSQSVIGALRVNLGLDSAQFERGVKRVKNPLNELRGQFLKVAGAATALGVGLSALAMKGANEIDRLAKGARRLDSPIESFRALELAAAEAGVSVGAVLNDTQTMMRELAKESDNTKNALATLGLTAGELRNLDADTQLATIADRVKELGLSSGETSVLLQSLGIRNRDMVLLLMQGGDALRNARDDVRDYGLSLSAVDASRIEEANDRIARLSVVGQFLRQELALNLVPAFGRFAQVITDSMREGGFLRRTIEIITSNIERLAITVGVAVTAFGVRYVAALAAAKIATMTLAGSLAFLRGALIRTGIGAIIVAVGELIFQFTRLVSAVGSVGGAFAALRDVSQEIFERIGEFIQVAAEFAKSGWFGVKAAILDALDGALTATVSFADRVIGAFNGAFEGIKAIWNGLPGAIGAIVFGAVNATISGIEFMLNSVTRLVNRFVERINKVLASLPDWATRGGVAIELMAGFEIGRIENPFEGQASEMGEGAASAFNEAFQRQYLADGPTAFSDMAKQAGVTSEALRAGARVLAQYAGRPLQSVEAIREALRESGEMAEMTHDEVNRLADALDTAGGNAQNFADTADDMSGFNTEFEKTNMLGRQIGERMASTFASIATGAQDAKQAVMGLLEGIAQMIVQQAIINAMRTAGFPGFANGTPFAPGGLAMVGERGPELVNLPRGSKVMDAQRTKGMMGDGGGDTVINQTINVTTGVQQTVRTEVLQLLPQIAEASKRAVLDARKRGGSFSAAFGT